MEDALQSLPSSASGTARHLIIEAIDSNNVFGKIINASQASIELGCDDPQDQEEGMCELLSLAISDFALNRYLPSDVLSQSQSPSSSSQPSLIPSVSISPSTSIQPSTECTDQLERLEAKLNACEEPTSIPSNLPSSSSLPSSSAQPSSSAPTCQQNEPTKVRR